MNVNPMNPVNPMHPLDSLDSLGLDYPFLGRMVGALKR